MSQLLKEEIWKKEICQNLSHAVITLKQYYSPFSECSAADEGSEW